jgi:hypothetical protein
MPLEAVLDDLSADRAWTHLVHITEQMPSRLAGTPNARRMAEYAAGQLAESGLVAALHEFPGLVSFPEPAEVRVLSPEPRVVAANTLAQSASTDGLEGELLYVGAGTETDYTGIDVRGKITLSDLPYAPARHEKARIAWRMGAAAQIMTNWGHPESEALPLGSVKSAWGNPTPETLETELPDLVCVGISKAEGLRLKAACEAGPVRVRLRARAENGWRPITMTSGELDAPDERSFLLVGGHMDSWFGPQATDNASGSACILELLRVFTRYRGELRRGIVAGFWMGHETGTMISSARFADLHWDRLRKHAVAYLQIDQPAIAGTSTWHLHSTDEAQAWATRAARETLGDVAIHWRRQRKTGDSSFFGAGLPSVAGLMSFTDEQIQATDLANLGWWHHSIHNTLDKVDRELLAPHLRLYARWMWDLLTAPVLPFAFEPVASRFLDRLSELARLEIPDIDMAGAVERARAFQSVAERLDAAARDWRAQAAGGDAERAAEILNEALMRLSRVLVPIASTVAGTYGQDRYGHPWQAQLIPSLSPYPQLAGYARDTEAFQTWWVAMIRARNRIVDALDQASDIARAALHELGQ